MSRGTAASDPAVGATEAIAAPAEAAEFVPPGYGFSAADLDELRREVENFYLPGEADAAARARLQASIHWPDLVLARACARGDEAAWSEFLRRFQPKLRAMARALIRGQAEAWEFADSMFAELFGLRGTAATSEDAPGAASGAALRAATGKLARYMGGGSLEAWLRTVLTQRRIDEWRRHRWTVSWEEVPEPTLHAAAARVTPGRAASLEAAALPKQTAALRAAVGEALAALAGEDKLVLTLYFLDGRNLAEIGRLLRLHESTMSRRIHRLEKQLRKAIVRGLQRRGWDRRAALEAMATDVRELNLDLRGPLTAGQEAEAADVDSAAASGVGSAGVGSSGVGSGGAAPGAAWRAAARSAARL